MSECIRKIGRRVRLIPTALAAALLLLAPGCGRREAAPENRGPNIVLIVVDAMRADRLSCYGYDRPTSPNLDALAAEGVLFTDAMAQGAETVTSIPSLLTGRLPREHGVLWVQLDGKVYSGPGLRLPTLAEMLKKHGYVTAAISASPLVGPGIGVDRGFDYFDQECGRVSVWQLKSADKLNQRAQLWLDRYRPGQGPFFLYLHYLDTHNQYRPPSAFAAFGRPGYTSRDNQVNADYNDVFDPQQWTPVTDRALAEHGLSRRDVERLSDLYDGEVACADHYIGELLLRLKHLGLYDDTIIVVTADHGEAFLEHQEIKHGGSLYQELLRVPLILRLPGLRGGQEVQELVEGIDLVPTLLDAAGIKTSAKMSGHSYDQALVRGEKIPPRIGLAELPSRKMEAVRDGSLKLIASPGGVELYDLSQDPGEKRNLVAARPDEVARLEGDLREVLAQHPPAPEGTQPASERELEALRALGYLK
jgi:arylsulfatase A-like enzyme